MTLGEYLKTIADSIRAKTGGTAAIKASDFAPAIRGFLDFRDVKSVSGEGAAEAYYYDPDNNIGYPLSASCVVKGIHRQDANVLTLDVECYVCGVGESNRETQTLKIDLV